MMCLAVMCEQRVCMYSAKTYIKFILYQSNSHSLCNQGRENMAFLLNVTFKNRMIYTVIVDLFSSRKCTVSLVYVYAG